MTGKRRRPELQNPTLGDVFSGRYVPSVAEQVTLLVILVLLFLSLIVGVPYLIYGG